MAARHGHVELAQDFLALVFVDLHGLLGGMGWSGLPGGTLPLQADRRLSSMLFI
jgi:hypothetical protein